MSDGKSARELNNVIRYTAWSVFRSAVPFGDAERAPLAAEVDALIDELAAKDVTVRGTYDVSEWDDACAEANDIDPESGIDELMDMPLLASHLEAGLAAFDYSCDGVGQLD